MKKFVKNWLPGIFFIVLAAALFYFSFNAGKSDSPALSLEASKKAAETSEEIPAAEPVDINSLTLYFTPNGAKWHLDRACRYLKNSATVNETDYKTATEKGLTPCSGCASDYLS